MGKQALRGHLQDSIRAGVGSCTWTSKYAFINCLNSSSLVKGPAEAGVTLGPSRGKRAGPEVGAQEEAQEVDTGEPLLSVGALEGTPASLLLKGLTGGGSRWGLQQRRELGAISIAKRGSCD